MSLPKAPMLAGKYVEDKLKLPCYVQPKLDGIRCLIKDGVAYSRQLKPIPNKFIQDFFKMHPKLDGLDGELIVGKATNKLVYRKTMSGVMSEDGYPDFSYQIYDYMDDDQPFCIRIKKILQIINVFRTKRIELVITRDANSLEDISEFEQACVSKGYEGVIIRSIYGKYKHGRSTVKEGYLLKLKRFLDAEATIIGYEELETNKNEATISELGHTKRSSHKAGKVRAGTLGSLIVSDKKTGLTFGIGTGFDQEMRRDIWLNRKGYMGRLVKYKYVKVGGYDLPRFPVFLGFRSILD